MYNYKKPILNIYRIINERLHIRFKHHISRNIIYNNEIIV